MIVRQTGVDGVELWDRGVWLRREGESKEDKGEIFKMGIRSKWKNTRVYGKGEASEREIDREGEKKGMRV